MTTDDDDSGQRDMETTELDPRALRGLLESKAERESRPTMRMHKDVLVGLVDRTSGPDVAANTIPRSLVEQRSKLGSGESTPIADDPDAVFPTDTPRSFDGGQAFEPDEHVAATKLLPVDVPARVNAPAPALNDNDDGISLAPLFAVLAVISVMMGVFLVIMLR